MRSFPPLVPLGDVLTQDRVYVAAPESRRYPKLSVKLYGRGVVLDGTADGSLLKMKRHQIARARQVILSEIWGKRGAIGFVPPEGEGALCTSHFFLFDVRTDRAEPSYLQALFTSNYLEKQLGSTAKGTTGYAATRPKHLLGAMIPLPPLGEQRRIVARIEAVAAKIEEARGLARQAADVTASFPASLHLSLAHSRVVTLRQILVPDECREDVRPGREYPQVGVRAFGQGLFPKAAVSSDQTTYRSFNRLYGGAVVLSQVKGWEGAVAVCPRSLAGRYASPEYRTFRCVPGQAVPEYLAVLFSAPWFWTRLKGLTRGVGARRERIRPEHFLEMELPMPAAEFQERAARILGRVAEARRLQEGSVAELDALLPSVLDRAFRGER